MSRFPVVKAEEFSIRNGLGAQGRAIRSLPSYQSSLRNSKVVDEHKRGFYVELFASKHLLDIFIAEVWPEGSTASGLSQMKRCKRYAKDYESKYRRPY